MTLKQIHILVYTVSDVFTLHNNKYNNNKNLRTEKWMTLREIYVLAYTVSNICISVMESRNSGERRNYPKA